MQEPIKEDTGYGKVQIQRTEDEVLQVKFPPAAAVEETTTTTVYNTTSIGPNECPECSAPTPAVPAETKWEVKKIGCIDSKGSCSYGYRLEKVGNMHATRAEAEAAAIKIRDFDEARERASDAWHESVKRHERICDLEREVTRLQSELAAAEDKADDADNRIRRANQERWDNEQERS